MKKILSILLITIFMAASFASCSEKAVTYKDDVKTFNIYSTITTLLKNNTETYVYGAEGVGFESLGEDIYQGDTHVKYYIGLNTDLTSDYFVETTGGNGCFEYGIFKANSEEAKGEIIATLQAYIVRLQNDDLGLSYSPEDKLILDKATVKSIGNYVVFVIAPEEDANTIFIRTENLLTAE